MIHTDNLTKTFLSKKESVEAVKQVSIDVADGELVAFLGPNGAGKSTTLRMLTTLLSPTSGSARVAGFDVVAEPAQVRAHIGYIGQGSGGGRSYRLRDELHNQGRFFHQSKDVYTRRAAELITALELDGKENTPGSKLSGGQRRRLDVALGLMNNPGLLFLDEPSTGLDPHARANLWQHILAMRERYGMTMVLTTHYLDEADSMSERVIVIDHGVVIADSTADRLKRDFADDVITLALPPGANGALACETVSAIASFNSVESVATASGLDLVLKLEHGAETLPRTLYALKAQSIDVLSADLKQASLDDVFLNLTGRSLREEAA